MNQDSLFGMPDPIPVKPVKVKKSDKASWTQYKTKDRVPCDDCSRAYVEHIPGELLPPLARAARMRLVIGNESFLLCYEHAELRGHTRIRDRKKT